MLIKGTELKHIHKKFYSEDTEFEINKYNETTDSVNAVMDLLQDLPPDAMVSSLGIHSTSIVSTTKLYLHQIQKQICTIYLNPHFSKCSDCLQATQLGLNFLTETRFSVLITSSRLAVGSKHIPIPRMTGPLSLL